MATTPHHSEFDAFARNYDAGMDDPAKRIVGGTADTFLEHKAAWLQRNVDLTGRLLDFGCGTGGFLRALQRQRPQLDLVGCDVAAGMIEEAERQWGPEPRPPLHVVPPGPLPFADATFDTVTAVCVLHHVMPAARVEVTRELLRVVRPGGIVAIFEHNPLSPVTRWFVRRAPIDANAVLLSARECTTLLASAGAIEPRTDYILFFPPRLRPLWRAEHLLARVPLGGQYATVGTRAP